MISSSSSWMLLPATLIPKCFASLLFSASNCSVHSFISLHMKVHVAIPHSVLATWTFLESALRNPMSMVFVSIVYCARIAPRSSLDAPPQLSRNYEHAVGVRLCHHGLIISCNSLMRKIRNDGFSSRDAFKHHSHAYMQTVDECVCNVYVPNEIFPRRKRRSCRKQQPHRCHLHCRCLNLTRTRWCFAIRQFISICCSVVAFTILKISSFLMSFCTIWLQSVSVRVAIVWEQMVGNGN